MEKAVQAQAPEIERSRHSDAYGLNSLYAEKLSTERTFRGVFVPTYSPRIKTTCDEFHTVVGIDPFGLNVNTTLNAASLNKSKKE